MALDMIYQFYIIESLGDILNDNLEDIKKDRKSKTWIMPTFPEADSNLPQLTIQFSNASYEDDSSEDILYEQKDDNSYTAYKAKKVSANVTIYAISNAKTEFDVSFQGSKIHVTNQKANVYLAEYVKNFINQNKALMKSFCNSFKIDNLDIAYQDGTNRWVSEIQCTVEYRDVWAEEYLSGQLINTYSTTLQ